MCASMLVALRGVCSGPLLPGFALSGWGLADWLVWCLKERTKASVPDEGGLSLPPGNPLGPWAPSVSLGREPLCRAPRLVVEGQGWGRGAPALGGLTFPLRAPCHRCRHHAPCTVHKAEPVLSFSSRELGLDSVIERAV